MGKIVEPTYEALVEFLTDKCRDVLPEICTRANECSRSAIGEGDATPREAVVEDLLARWMGDYIGFCDWCGDAVNDECLTEINYDSETGTSDMICASCNAMRRSEPHTGKE